jgi:hypothetical protein
MPNFKGSSSLKIYIVTLAVTVAAEETPERGGEVRLGR